MYTRYIEVLGYETDTQTDSCTTAASRGLGTRTMSNTIWNKAAEPQIYFEVRSKI